MNSLFVIKPYDHHGTWVFDDEKVGLVREPFIMGIPAIINKYVEKINDAKEGFTAIFSSVQFPGYDLVLEKTKEESGGAWYKVDDMKGWLCPALKKYFPAPPEKIFLFVWKNSFKFLNIFTDDGL